MLKKRTGEGVGCLNYKLKNGQMKLFEINPRVGFSLAPNLDELLLAIAYGEGAAPV